MVDGRARVAMAGPERWTAPGWRGGPVIAAAAPEHALKIDRVLAATIRKTASHRIADPMPPAIAASLVLALEPRFMFDAAGVATAVDHADQQAAEQAADAAEADDGEDASQGRDHAVALDQALADAAPAASTTATDGAVPDQGRREVVFVDTRVGDWQELLQGLRAGVESPC